MEVLLILGIVILTISIRAFRLERTLSLCRKEYIKKHKLKYIEVSYFYLFFKRIFDVVISAIVCITILPILYLVIGIAIKLTSEGPIIFKQQRLGLFGEKFICYKFRSMYQDAGPQKVIEKDDDRITPVGRILRRTHLDEFPQFWNVLKGDMSLVGPRPLSDFAIKKFNGAADIRYRTLLRPGITGLTQVNSGRFLSVQELLWYDKMYVFYPSLIKDLWLCIKTLKFGDVAY